MSGLQASVPFSIPLLLQCSPQVHFSVFPRSTPDLGGIQLAMVQLEDLQGGLEIGLWLQQFQFYWPQAVNTGR